MRTLISITSAVAMLVAQVPLVPAFGQSAPSAPQTATQNSVIAAAFKAFPSGGEPLRMRIADLISAHPKLAAELVVYLRNAQGVSRAQKVAAEHGLAAAADRLGIKAADMSVVPANEQDPGWIAVALAILGIGAIVGGVYYFTTKNDDGSAAVAVPSPH